MTAIPRTEVSWHRAVARAWQLAPLAVFVAFLVWKVSYYHVHPDTLWSDAHVYFRATEAWVAGGDPWAAHDDLGIMFAAPPPALLLNLPFLVLGEDLAVGFWVIGGIGGILLAIRHFRLPFWWIAFPPFVEGLLSGSPDVVLLGTVVIGAGGIAALVKPYAIPGMLGERRYHAVGAAVIAGALSLALLPWSVFLARLPEVGATVSQQARSEPLGGIAVLVVVAAVLSLRRDGLTVATPALWPAAQLHYAVFSLRLARESSLLAIGFALPGGAPIAVVTYATWRFVQGRRHPTADSVVAP